MTPRTRATLITIAILSVLAVLWLNTPPGLLELAREPQSHAAYNRLVDGFASGHLSFNELPPPGLAQLADPYDPVANAPYRPARSGSHDVSYYRGRFYLYFGPTPALLLFWPYRLLTGHYLPHRFAVLAFGGIGFLFACAIFFAVAGLLRRVGKSPSPAPAAAPTGPERGDTLPLLAGVLALGLATSLPYLLERGDLWEVPIACGYCLTSASLFFLWRSLAPDANRPLQLALASLAYGLAVGARPSLLFGSVILIVPLLKPTPPPSAGTPSTSSLTSSLLSALLPLSLCLAALLLYNHARFGNPLEFGEHYQLAGDRQDTARHFSLAYVPFNFWVYFLAPVRLARGFPFLGQIAAVSAPPGHAPIEDPFGVLINVPITLFAVFAPLAWRGLPGSDAARLRRFILALALLFFTSTAVLLGFYGTTSRYEFEFLPALVLLALFGFWGLDRSLGPRVRLAARALAAVLLAFSLAFNLLFALERYAKERTELAGFIADGGNPRRAVDLYRQALRVYPDLAEAHNDLGNVWLRLGNLPAALSEYETALSLAPASAPEEYNFANLLVRSGRPADAVPHYEAALRLKPDYAEAHHNLAVALYQLGRTAEAEAHLREAIRLRPNRP